MELDLAQAGGDLGGLAAKLRSQVCIVGGGIAGLTLAESLVGAGVSVTILEAGGHGGRLPEAEGDPFQAELQGRPHRGTRLGRVRALGGCSRTWGGQLLPLPEDAGWPVRLPELRRYEPRETTEIYEGEAFFAEHRLDEPRLLGQLGGFHARVSRFLPFSQRNFAETPQARQLLADRKTRVVLHAAVSRLVLAPLKDRVTGAEIRLANGQVMLVEAEQYVVAAGTVETCRLLLASGAGRESGQVGRNFHDHLTVSAATFHGAARRRILRELRPWVERSPGVGRGVRSLKLEPTAALREQLGVKHAMVHLTIEEPGGSGVDALRQMLRLRQERGLWGAFRWGVAKLPGAALMGLRLAFEAGLRRRRYVSRRATVRLQVNLAQRIPSASEVRLQAAADPSGMPGAVVDWRVEECELNELRRLATYLRSQLQAAGLDGGLWWQGALFQQGEEADAELRGLVDDARQAMGGACMGLDSRASVVDPELRVHGVGNLSVASPAVFPDGCAQLPTLTLMALCRRLAERLASQIVHSS